MADGLLHRIEAAGDGIAALTADLVRVPTLNPPGLHYRDICELLARRLEASGFACELMRAEGTPGDSEKYPRWNLLARREGRAGGTCAHFNGHTDVVEVGRGWTRDPFGGEIADGKVWGRGACDMKGGLAAAIVAAECFVAEYPDFPGAIEISATADEETGGYGGVAWMAERGLFDPARVQHVIIPEPLGVDRVCLGHRGVWWAEIETLGRIAHGSMPFLGECAARHMGAVLAEMERTLWPALAARRTAMPVIPEGARSSTLNVNSIHAGLPEPEAGFTGLPEPEAGFTGLPSPCVPDSARMVIDRRFLAEESVEEVEREVRDLLDRVAAERDMRYEVREVLRVLPSMTDRDAPVVTALNGAISDVLGREAAHVCSPGTYDQKHVDRIGRLKNCVAYGPGKLELAHQPDEHVALDDLTNSAKVMGRALERLLCPTGGPR